MNSNHQTNSAQAWHALTASDTVQALDTDVNSGLNAEEIAQRLGRYGPNQIEDKGGRTPLQILVEQFTNVMLLMLMAVALVSGVLDFQAGEPPKDALAILSLVIFNGVLGYLQESKAEKALAALKNMAAPIVRVIRDGKVQEVPAKELVPGDVMLLEAGVQVSADGRLLEAQNLQVRESALTGEAQAVTKQAMLQLPEDAPLGDRLNLVFQGTEVINGRGKAVVTSTGLATEIGHIAQMIQSVENEPTPLQQRMDQLTKLLVKACLIIVGVVVIGGTIVNPSNFKNLLEISLSMAVAVVPEALPAVITVTLALGTQKMVRRNALIRRLPAVETLGSVSAICSDKTGTLTQNKMVVQQVHTGDSIFDVTGTGYAPVGEFLLHQQSGVDQNWRENRDLRSLLFACVLCNDAVLDPPVNGKPDWTILGDPTEGALLSLAGKANILGENLQGSTQRLAEFPFSSERKRMSVVCQGDIGVADNSDGAKPNYLMFTKGSPELTLERCTQIQLQGQMLQLTEEMRASILELNNQMAGGGLRVLGFACKPLSELFPPETTEDIAERDLVWLGLVGIIDPPRPEAKAAVAKCRQAGIRPVMITGDHQLTAEAIARELGIANPGDVIITGQELEKLSQSELEAVVDRTSVYARVSPEHKLRIVRAMQSRGQFVAMTGDGVNDAPALKQADIGIAMGITGTDVSKEASDMILLDDNFATIIAATEEGRVIYNNIRLFIKYIFGSNIGELLTIVLAPFILPETVVPLIPLQILWMNLVTDGFPALALAVEPSTNDVMQQPPQNPRQSIFAGGMGYYTIRIGIVFAIINITLMLWGYHHTHSENYAGDPDAWKTMVFTSLCVAQMGHALAVRSKNRLIAEMNLFSNPSLLAAAVITVIVQIAMIYITPVREFFGMQLLNTTELLVVLGFSSLLFVWVDLEKLFLRWYFSRR
ncbi:MAG TPA: cation-translocating P-type ATPase [Oscillatoriaceae cyanobacterium M33_DOE_052]|uniref:Cation-translocating P-type ATPase n=1 Tax=Planktothricoides sp. SpSt-374 TaxID=2282167 RepID=A0A7C3ZWX3_9CYAN|nr:cation-translocating P-type ATPase [Oscillatoriaceae cyanobacterium M33_DOE_052]